MVCFYVRFKEECQNTLSCDSINWNVVLNAKKKNNNGTSIPYFWQNQSQKNPKLCFKYKSFKISIHWNIYNNCSKTQPISSHRSTVKRQKNIHIHHFSRGFYVI